MILWVDYPCIYIQKSKTFAVAKFLTTERTPEQNYSLEGARQNQSKAFIEKESYLQNSKPNTERFLT